MLGGVCWLKPLIWRYCGRWQGSLTCASPCQRSFVYQCGWPARILHPRCAETRSSNNVLICLPSFLKKIMTVRCVRPCW